MCNGLQLLNVYNNFLQQNHGFNHAIVFYLKATSRDISHFQRQNRQGYSWGLPENAVMPQWFPKQQAPLAVEQTDTGHQCPLLDAQQTEFIEVGYEALWKAILLWRAFSLGIGGPASQVYKYWSILQWLRKLINAKVVVRQASLFLFLSLYSNKDLTDKHSLFDKFNCLKILIPKGKNVLVNACLTEQYNNFKDTVSL